MKPRVAYLDFMISQLQEPHPAWMQSFERIKKLGQGAKLNGWTVIWIHEDPDWLQIKRKHEKKMVRKGDPMIFDLTCSPR